MSLLLEILVWASGLFIGTRSVNSCYCALSHSFLVTFKCSHLLIVSKNQNTDATCFFNTYIRVDSFITLSMKIF